VTRTLVISGILAAVVHLAALFGLRDSTPPEALPLAVASVEVQLISAAPTPETAVESTPEIPAEMPPEPIPEPPPEPEPEPEPVIPPTPEPTPTPLPEPAAVETPAPPATVQPKQKVVKKPQPPAKKQLTARPKSQPASPSSTSSSGGTRGGGAAGPNAKKVGPNTQIRVRSNPAPRYPAAARQTRQEGTVTLDVQVSAAGTPVSVNLAKSSGHTALDQAAITAVRRWSFAPATVAGIATSGRVRVPVRFKLSK
jgi:periplasmic protein TonB